MAQIVIIGAGLTGLATAYALEQHGINDYVIYERETTCGGLCRSVRQQEFTFDYTGHFLHSTNPDVLAFLEATIGFKQLVSIERGSAIFSQDTYTAYPYQSNLYGLPVSTIAQCIEGFVYRKKPKNLPPDSFAAWVLQHFGHGFAQNFFYPYQEKLLCHSVRTITNTWVGNFVPNTSLEKIITSAIKPPQESVGYNAHFYYPRAGGIDNLIGSIIKKIKKQPLVDHEAVQIDAYKRIIYFANGHHEPFEYLVNTAPLDNLLTSTEQTRLSRAAAQLHCNYLLNINLGIARPEIVPHHWIYYPEKKYPFFRIGIPHLLTASMAPHKHSSLAVEIAYRHRPRSFKKGLAETVAIIKTLFNIDKSDIAYECILHLPHAYVLYDHWRDTHLHTILAELTQQNIYSTGRYGAWKYSSMQDAILDGMLTAQQIANQIQERPAVANYTKQVNKIVIQKEP